MLAADRKLWRALAWVLQAVEPTVGGLNITGRSALQYSKFARA